MVLFLRSKPDQHTLSTRYPLAEHARDVRQLRTWAGEERLSASRLGYGWRKLYANSTESMGQRTRTPFVMAEALTCTTRLPDGRRQDPAPGSNWPGQTPGKRRSASCTETDDHSDDPVARELRLPLERRRRL
jgi:hypothetical protein